MSVTLIIATTPAGYTAASIRATAAGCVNIQHVPAVLGSDVILTDRSIVSAEAAYTISKAATWPSCGTPNAVGCMLSHIAAWRIAATLPEPTIILEEDVAFTSKTAPTEIAAAASKQPFDVLMLGGHLAPSKTGAPAGVYRVNDRVFCSEAYLVTPAAATKLLVGSTPVVTQIDAYLGARTLDLGVYAIRPALAFQTKHASTIQVTSSRLAGSSVCSYQQSSRPQAVHAAITQLVPQPPAKRARLQ